MRQGQQSPLCPRPGTVPVCSRKPGRGERAEVCAVGEPWEPGWQGPEVLVSAVVKITSAALRGFCLIARHRGAGQVARGLMRRGLWRLHLFFQVAEPRAPGSRGLSPEPDPGHTSPVPLWQSWPWPGRPGGAPAPTGVSGLVMSVLSGLTGVGGALVTSPCSAGPLQGASRSRHEGVGRGGRGAAVLWGAQCGPLGSGGDGEGVWLVRLSWGTAVASLDRTRVSRTESQARLSSFGAVSTAPAPWVQRDPRAPAAGSLAGSVQSR